MIFERRTPTETKATSLGLLALIWSGVAVRLFSRNYLCSTVFGAVLGAVVFSILDKFVLRRAPRKRRTLIRALGVLVVGLAVAYLPPFRLTDRTAFSAGFGVPLPAGVRVLDADATYLGGPGDYTLVVLAETKPTMIDQLLRTLHAAPVDPNDAGAAHAIPSGLAFGGAKWLGYLHAMQTPERYQTPGAKTFAVERRWFVVERSTGRILAVASKS